jgi:hypothetical protein
MKNYTIQERFFVFLGLICLGTWFTGYYYHYKWDRDIQQSIHRSDEVSQKHLVHSMTKSMAIDHWKSMYLAQKEFSSMLEKQIDVINNYWSKENSKLKDELFDLKNSDPSKRK